MAAVSSRVRRLELLRLPSSEGTARGYALCWSQPGLELSPAELPDGKFVVRDHTIMATAEADPGPGVAQSIYRERLTSDPEEQGIVYAWDGRRIGRVRVGARGGVLLEYAWPSDLAARAPEMLQRSADV